MSRPYRSSDLLMVVVLDGIALAGLIVAWFGVSGGLRFADQTGATSLGVAALVLSAVGHALFLINQRRTLGDQLGSMLGAEGHST